MKTFLVKKSLFIFSTGILCLIFACSMDIDSDTDTNGGKSGSITRFVTYKEYMYALNQHEVRTYSLAKPDKPELVHILPTDYGLETIIIYEDFIYIGSRTSLYILDISQPRAPTLTSQTDRMDIFQGGCDPVVVKGDYAYSTVKIIENICGQLSSFSALIVYDVQNKNAPVEKGVYPLEIPNGLGYKDQYLFICDEGADKVVLFDISNPLSLKLLNYNIPITDPYDVIVDGNKLIVSAKTAFQFYDITDIGDIRPIGKITK
jgi:hypothetical protein